MPKPPSALNFRPIRGDDGWCDDPKHAAYNRLIRLPYISGAPNNTAEKHPSHERLWREDGAYDIILIMSHNDSPPQAGMGSAVFIHIAQPDDRQTLGCVALPPETMTKFIQHIRCGDTVVIAK